jgi:hypothetical protein
VAYLETKPLLVVEREEVREQRLMKKKSSGIPLKGQASLSTVAHLEKGNAALLARSPRKLGFSSLEFRENSMLVEMRQWLDGNRDSNLFSGNCPPNLYFSDDFWFDWICKHNSHAGFAEPAASDR